MRMWRREGCKDEDKERRWRVRSKRILEGRQEGTFPKNKYVLKINFKKKNSLELSFLMVKGI